MNYKEVREKVDNYVAACIAAKEMNRPLLRREPRRLMEAALHELCDAQCAPQPPAADPDFICRCGHRCSQHSDRSMNCYECKCDFAQVP